MNSLPNKILITCFDFPPNEGIGGRRWSKICKQLVGNGFEVHVIKCEPKPENRISPWIDDVASDKILVHELPRTYPYVLSNPSNDLKSKIKYKLTRSNFLRKYKGTIYDNALGWESIYSEKLKEIVEKEGIQNVIVTGAPFNLFYYTAKFKVEFPHLNLILDYRDPWINAPNYGMRNLDEKRSLFEREKQQFSLEMSNYVICPSQPLESEIRESLIDPMKIKAEFKTITHYYDIDDYKMSKSIPLKNNKIHFVYGGSIYMETEQYINLLDESLSELKESDITLYNKLKIEFFTDHTSRLESLKKHEVVSIQKPIGSDYYSKVMEADFAFIFLASHNKNFKTTKYFETLPLKTPFVYLGPEGDTCTSIESDSLGYVIKTKEDFLRVIQDAKAENIQYDFSYDHKQFSLERITKQVMELFI